VFRRFLTLKALYSKAQGQRRRESGRAPPWVIVEQNSLRRRRNTGRWTVALFLWNAFGVRVFCGSSPRVRGRPRLRPGNRDPGLWNTTASR